MKPPDTHDAASDPHADPHRSLRNGIARLLNVGTGIAAVLLVLGVVLLIRGGPHPQTADFAARSRLTDSVARIVGDALQGEADAIAMLGVVVLIFIPAARTLAAGVVFLRERDRVFVVLAVAIVATLLLASL